MPLEFVAEWCRRIEVLSVTAFPGLQRLIVLLLVERIYGIEFLGRLTSDLSIVSLFGFITATGWATLLLGQVPAVRSSRRVQLAFGISAWGLLVVLAGLAALFGLAAADLVFSPVETGALLIGWSAYQLVRHFMLAQQSYHKLFAIETTITLGTIAILMVADGREWSYRASSGPWLGTALLALVAGGHSLYRDKRRLRLAARSTFRKGIEYGSANLLSGGTAMLLAPIAVFLAGDAYGGILGLILGLLSVMMLLPRAMAFSHLPAVSSAVGRNDLNRAMSLHKNFCRQLFVLLLLMGGALLPGGIFLGSIYYPEIYKAEGVMMMFLCLLMYFSISQAMLPHSNLLVAMQQSAIQLRISISSFLIFVALAFLLPILGFSGPNAVLLALVALVLTTLLRYFLTTRAANLGIKEYGRRNNLAA